MRKPRSANLPAAAGGLHDAIQGNGVPGKRTKGQYNRKRLATLAASRFNKRMGYLQRLSMTTASMGSSTAAVEATSPITAMEPAATATVEAASPITTMEPAATASLESTSPITAVEPAATVKPVTATGSATLEAATTMEPLAAVEALVPAESTAAMPSAFATESAMVTAPTATVVAAPSAIVTPTVVATTVVTEPRSYANKHAVVKIIRTVISVGRARVGRIVIVAVRTIRRGADVPGADSHHNLGMSSTSRQEHEKPDHNHIL